jgi:hypothetical protein
MLGVLDQHAAGGKIRAGHVRQQRCVDAFGMAQSDGSRAAQTSPALCGGMLVAMPTAMPAAPFAKQIGKRAGSTTGSLSSPS